MTESQVLLRPYLFVCGCVPLRIFFSSYYIFLAAGDFLVVCSGGRHLRVTFPYCGAECLLTTNENDSVESKHVAINKLVIFIIVLTELRVK